MLEISICVLVCTIFALLIIGLLLKIRTCEEVIADQAREITELYIRVIDLETMANVNVEDEDDFTECDEIIEL